MSFSVRRTIRSTGHHLKEGYRESIPRKREISRCRSQHHTGPNNRSRELERRRVGTRDPGGYYAGRQRSFPDHGLPPLSASFRRRPSFGGGLSAFPGTRPQLAAEKRASFLAAAGGARRASADHDAGAGTRSV